MVSPRRNFENEVTSDRDGNVSDQYQKSDSDNHKRRRSPSNSPRRRSRSRDRDFRRSPRRRSRSPQSKSRMVLEPDDWEKSTAVFLDSYNCDLNLLIDANNYQARPQTEGGFSLMWAGVRANFGTVSGKAFYEVRIVKNIQVENYDSLVGGATHVLRVGWSTENTDFALGEEAQSYGYGGTGKKSCNNKFTDYGCAFGEGDVVGSFIEWTNTEAVLRFSVNGVDQGECYRVQKSQLGERFALFPHVYVKNVEFACNFGQDSQSPWFNPNIPGDDPLSWQLINNLPLSCRIHGRCPPQSKSECDVIMMVGLPGAGKTYFAERYIAEHREKQYNVLGTNLILDKMKVMGVARQRNYHGRWDVLIDKATKCLNTLIGVACMRRRNYILDQTNVYPSAQRRKMRPFEGFKRKAIVIVPTDEEFRRRIAQREKEEGKEVPETAVLEMKANFGIPRPVSEDPSSVFDEVIFIELGLDDAKTLVTQYNQEGQANRQPPEKRQRWDGGNRDRDDSRNSRFRGRDSRDRGRDMGRGRRDDFRSSPGRRNDDRGRRDYRGGYNASRDRSREGDRFDRNNDRESFGRQSGGRFGGGPPGGRFGPPQNRGSFPGGMSGPGGFGGYDGSRVYGQANTGDEEPMGSAYGMNDGAAPALPQPSYESGPMSGGFRGGYAGAGRGAQMQGPRGAPSRGAAPWDVERVLWGVQQILIGVLNESDREMGGGGFPDDNQQYIYSGAEGYQNAPDELYSGPANEDYRSRRFGGAGPYGAGSMQKPPTSPTGYPNTAGSGNYAKSNAPPYGNLNSGPNYPNSFSGDQNRSGRPGMHQNPSASYGGSHGYGSNDPEKTGMSQSEHQNTEVSSLYAAGAARYSDSRPPAPNMPQAPRQSRFDTKPEGSAPAQPSAYSTYSMGSNYTSGYTGGFASSTNQKTAPLQASNPSGGPRGGRSRFDVGPPAAQSIPSVTAVQSTLAGNVYNPPVPSQSTNRPQPQVQQTQNSAKLNYRAMGMVIQLKVLNRILSYGAYNYGYGYNAYGTQAAQASAVSRPTAPTTGSTQSLYASAVADKPQPTQQANTPVASSMVVTTTTTSTASDQSAAAAYASYYYGAPQSAGVTTQGAGKYDAAMAAAQQFNAWQQQQQPSAVSGSVSSSVPSAPTATVTPQTPSVNPYASYYPGYSTYPSSYGTMPVGGVPPGTMPTAPAPTMGQYYTGYR
ncbi:unnamed protein product [Heterobilharzia americana]|nr:unnamed protein product [Heterobilharzia americana]